MQRVVVMRVVKANRLHFFPRLGSIKEQSIDVFHLYLYKIKEEHASRTSMRVPYIREILIIFLWATSIPISTLLRILH